MASDLSKFFLRIFTSYLKPTINLSKFFLIKILCYMVYVLAEFYSCRVAYDILSICYSAQFHCLHVCLCIQ